MSKQKKTFSDMFFDHNKNFSIKNEIYEGKATNSTFFICFQKVKKLILCFNSLVPWKL